MSSLAEMPADAKGEYESTRGLSPDQRLRAPDSWLGTVFGSVGDCIWTGGEKGPGFDASTTLAELALRARSFSARSARKKMSRGDCPGAMSADGRRCCGVGASESVAGGDGSRLMRSVFRTDGESSALARKLGIGRDDGKGDALNVAPANAGAAAGLLCGAVCGGVARPCFAAAGDATCCLGRALLLPLRGLPRVWLGCDDEGAGLFAADLRGVKGSASSIGNTASLGMSFSEAYILRAGELTGRFARRRPGVLFWGGRCWCSIISTVA